MGFCHTVKKIDTSVLPVQSHFIAADSASTHRYPYWMINQWRFYAILITNDEVKIT